jgi:hypothetical protein
MYKYKIGVSLDFMRLFMGAKFLHSYKNPSFCLAGTAFFILSLLAVHRLNFPHFPLRFPLCSTGPMLSFHSSISTIAASRALCFASKNKDAARWQGKAIPRDSRVGWLGPFRSVNKYHHPANTQ